MRLNSIGPQSNFPNHRPMFTPQGGAKIADEGQALRDFKKVLHGPKGDEDLRSGTKKKSKFLEDVSKEARDADKKLGKRLEKSWNKIKKTVKGWFD